MTVFVETFTIFSRDARGQIRTWKGQANEQGQWRSVTGLENGAAITSAWTTCVARSQATPFKQAIFEMEAQRDKLLGKDYRISRDLVDVPRGSFIKPMLAGKYPGWAGPCFVQPKLDGMRCLANVEGLFSRGNKQIVAVPHIFEVLKREFFRKFPRVVLDGELYNHDHHDDFNGLMSICRKTKPTENDFDRAREVIQYHIYDCFFLDEPELTFKCRCDFLKDGVSNSLPFIHLVETQFCSSSIEVNSAHIDFVVSGYEGSIVRLNKPYEQKRSTTLLKNKDFQDGEFRLIAIEEGKGNWSGYAKRAICVTDEGVEFGAGIKGSQQFCATLLHTPVSAFQSVTIRHFGMTPDGSVRFPIAVSFNENGSLEPRSIVDSESTEEEF